MNLTVRRIFVALGLFIIVGGVMGFNLLASMKTPRPKKPVFSSKRIVDTLRVNNQNLATQLQIDGQLVAFDKIDLYTEVSGTLVASDRPFKEGSYFPKGSVLIKVDDKEAKLSVQAQKSSLLNAITQMMPDLKIDYPNSFKHWEKYLDQFSIEGPIKAFPEPIDKQEKLFIASRNLYSQYYSIKSAEERLSKYVIRAPFSGVLTQSSINAGTLVRTGQKLGELMNTSQYELEATIALKDLKYLKVGNQVELFSDAIEGSWKGKVKRINNQIDPNTQSVKVFVSVIGQNLKEGMYLKGTVEGSKIDRAVKIDKGLLVDNTNIYEIKDTILALHPVEVVKITEQHAIVRGIKDGTVLLKNHFPGMYDGMSVNIK